MLNFTPPAPPALAEARRLGLVHFSWRGSPRTLLAELRDRSRRFSHPEASVILDVFVRHGGLDAGELRGLAIAWAASAIEGLDLPDPVTGALAIVRQVVAGELDPSFLPVAETLAEGVSRDPSLRSLEREAARLVAATAAESPAVAAAGAGARAAIVRAHRRGLELGDYDPARDMGGYSPSWPAHDETLDAVLGDLEEVVA